VVLPRRFSKFKELGESRNRGATSNDKIVDRRLVRLPCESRTFGWNANGDVGKYRRCRVGQRKYCYDVDPGVERLRVAASHLSLFRPFERYSPSLRTLNILKLTPESRFVAQHISSTPMPTPTPTPTSTHTPTAQPPHPHFRPPIPSLSVPRIPR
jgi:hypothetical protein